jgi:membrane protein implicated in regulation of membrane protease activity
MVGRRGIAQQSLDPAGYVRINGELWLAEISGEEEFIEKGEKIRVRQVKGLKLIVHREGDTSDR